MCPARRPTSRSATRLHHRGPATAALANRLRRELHDWAAVIGLPANVVHDLTQCSYEAMANTVLHAYPAGTTGFLDLHAHLERDDIVVTVMDNGSWTSDEPLSSDGRDGLPEGGNGMRLIHDLAAHSKVIHGDEGTTVRMSWPRQHEDR